MKNQKFENKKNSHLVNLFLLFAAFLVIVIFLTGYSIHKKVETLVHLVVKNQKTLYQRIRESQRDFILRNNVMGKMLVGESYLISLALAYYDEGHIEKALELYNQGIPPLEAKLEAVKKKENSSYYLKYIIYDLMYAYYNRASILADKKGKHHKQKALNDLWTLHEQRYMEHLLKRGKKFWEDSRFKSLKDFPRYQKLLKIYSK